MSLARVFMVFLVLLMGVSGAAAAADQDATAKANILASFPEVDSEDISPSPIPGLYEVGIGASVSYISSDGRYLIRGDIYDSVTEENLTEARRTSVRVIVRSMTTMSTVSKFVICFSRGVVRIP